MNTPSLSYSKAIPLPFSGDELLSDFDFVSLSNGNTHITASKNTNAGGANSIKVNPGGAVQTFNSGAGSPDNTISYRSGTGTQFFSTPTANTQQTVSVGSSGGAGTLKVTQTAASNNQSLLNAVGNLSLSEWLLIGGGIVAIGLVFFLLKK